MENMTAAVVTPLEMDRPPIYVRGGFFHHLAVEEFVCIAGGIIFILAAYNTLQDPLGALSESFDCGVGGKKALSAAVHCFFMFWWAIFAAGESFLVLGLGSDKESALRTFVTALGVATLWGRKYGSPVAASGYKQALLDNYVFWAILVYLWIAPLGGLWGIPAANSSISTRIEGIMFIISVAGMQSLSGSYTEADWEDALPDAIRQSLESKLLAAA